MKTRTLMLLSLVLFLLTPVVSWGTTMTSTILGVIDYYDQGSHPNVGLKPGDTLFELKVSYDDSLVAANGEGVIDYNQLYHDNPLAPWQAAFDVEFNFSALLPEQCPNMLDDYAPLGYSYLKFLDGNLTEIFLATDFIFIWGDGAESFLRTEGNSCRISSEGGGDITGTLNYDVAPEPVPLLLLGIGLAGVAAMRAMMHPNRSLHDKT